MSQKTSAYGLECNSKGRFYLRIFFDLTDKALVNTLIVYQQLNGNLNLLNFEHNLKIL